MTKPLFARNGSSNPLGKCTYPLKTAVPEEIGEEFAAYVRLVHRKTVAEYLRDHIIEKMRGATFVLNQIVHRGQQAGTSEIGRESDEDGEGGG